MLERHRRVDRAPVAAVAEMHATGASTRKAQGVAEKMGVSRLSKDQVDAIAPSLDADIEDLFGRPLDGSPVPYVRLDATCVKYRREGRVASTAAVTAIGCDAIGEVFQGVAWQRRAVHLMREAGSWQLRRRVSRIVSQVFPSTGSPVRSCASRTRYGRSPGTSRRRG